MHSKVSRSQVANEASAVGVGTFIVVVVWRFIDCVFFPATNLTCSYQDISLCYSSAKQIGKLVHDKKDTSCQAPSSLEQQRRFIIWPHPLRFIMQLSLSAEQLWKMLSTKTALRPNSSSSVSDCFHSLYTKGGRCRGNLTGEAWSRVR